MSDLKEQFVKLVLELVRNNAHAEAIDALASDRAGREIFEEFAEAVADANRDF